MTVSTMTSTPKVVGIYESVRRLTSQERLMLARLLLDSVLSEEVDDHADWTALISGRLSKTGTTQRMPSTITGWKYRHVDADSS